MKKTYRVLAYLLPAIVALQAAFIAMAVYGLGSWVDDGHTLTKHTLDGGTSVTGDIGFALHGFGAMAAAVVALALLVVSFFAKIPGGVKWAAIVFADVVLQWVLAFVSFAAWSVGALHALNAFALFGLSMVAAQHAARSMGSAPEPVAPAGERV
jgi:hypothetical protein